MTAVLRILSSVCAFVSSSSIAWLHAKFSASSSVIDLNRDTGLAFFRHREAHSSSTILQTLIKTSSLSIALLKMALQIVWMFPPANALPSF